MPNVNLADHMLMEKLANLEPDPNDAQPDEMNKTASAPERGHAASSLLKAADISAASRRAGYARADAEIARMLGRG